MSATFAAAHVVRGVENRRNTTWTLSRQIAKGCNSELGCFWQRRFSILGYANSRRHAYVLVDDVS